MRRFGDALVPLDEVLVQAAVDLSGRPYVVHDEPDGMPPTIGPAVRDHADPARLRVVRAQRADHAARAGARRAADAHHMVEAQFKAVARALRDADRARPAGSPGIPSTKGVL